jgi:ketosteroid isomerase-like protein
MVSGVVERWRQAALAGDATALGALTTYTFTVVGPLGFVLDKQQWLGSYRSGRLHTLELETEELRVLELGDSAVAIGRHRQQTRYEDQPATGGEFRVSHVLVLRDGRWLVAAQHFCRISPPPSR